MKRAAGRPLRTHLCVASSMRAMPEKEIPPARPVNHYCAYFTLHNDLGRVPGRYTGPGLLQRLPVRVSRKRFLHMLRISGS